VQKILPVTTRIRKEDSILIVLNSGFRHYAPHYLADLYFLF
jgi:hypothetical protein